MDTQQRRDRVIDGLARGESQAHIARETGVSPSAITEDIARIAADEGRRNRLMAISWRLTDKIERHMREAEYDQELRALEVIHRILDRKPGLSKAEVQATIMEGCIRCKERGDHA